WHFACLEETNLYLSTSKLTIFIKPSNICNTAVLLISACLCEFFGRTEVIDNTLNPDFVRKFVLDFFFEEKQNLRFDVYNVDTRSSNLSKHDFLGQMFCTLGEIIGSPGGRLERTLSMVTGASCSGVILLPVVLICSTMQFCANKLDKKDFFGKSDPFLVFYRSNEDGTFTICHKTEVIKNNLNPVWQSFTIPVRALCNGDYDRTVKVDVYDWDRDGRYVFSLGVTLLFLALIFSSTRSNPSQPTSLHYMSPYQMNAYAMALKAVGEIIQDYDSDKLFPAYGFGAKLPPDGKISHAFPLNFNSENPNCVGIEGVLEAYFQSLRTVQLYGPTNFAPVINQVARSAAEVTDGSQYFVLLMITDGVISDMAQTKEAVVNVSIHINIMLFLLSSAMEELDGDEVRVSSRGRFAERDIVQVHCIRYIHSYLVFISITLCRIIFDQLSRIQPESKLNQIYLTFLPAKHSSDPPPSVFEAGSDHI
uniref:C2 domain-containing protein n=1 Tax=Neolamprologus brichardi TaxID=32507 RepID=A0A3Q4I1F0_NEOBR